MGLFNLCNQLRVPFFVQDLLSQDLNLSGFDKASILLEPVGRNTDAALTSSIASSDLLLFLPSDHFIPDVDAFIATIQSGIVADQSGYIVTFGVQPSFPSTDYGYTQKGGEIDNLTISGSSIYAVECFAEKPPFAKAQEMLLSGKYLWNASSFLSEASVLVDVLSKHAPDILRS